MRTTSGEGFVGALVLGLIVAVTATWSWFCGRQEVQLEAVKAGAAEWVAGEDGSAEFRWRTE